MRESFATSLRRQRMQAICNAEALADGNGAQHCGGSRRGEAISEDFAPEKRFLPCSQIPPLDALERSSPRQARESPRREPGTHRGELVRHSPHPPSSPPDSAPVRRVDEETEQFLREMRSRFSTQAVAERARQSLQREVSVCVFVCAFVGEAGCLCGALLHAPRCPPLPPPPYAPACFLFLSSQLPLCVRARARAVPPGHQPMGFAALALGV